MFGNNRPGDNDASCFKHIAIEDLYNNQSSSSDSSSTNAIDYDRIFVAISFISLIVEAASSGFNLISSQVNIASNIKRTIAIVFYIIHTLLTICAIVNSALAIKQAIDFRRANKKKYTCDKYVKYSNDLQVSENSLTIISQALWIVVCVSSLLMLYTSSNARLECALLYISILAPLFGVLSCILRVSDSTIKTKNPNIQEDKKKNAKWFTILYGIVLLVEIAHCACHIIEAMSLEGKMQNLYDFSNLPVLIIELATIFAFTVALIAEQCLNKPPKEEPCKSQILVQPLLNVVDDSTKRVQYCCMS
ncbi:hypothetical protein EDL79_01180 [Ehrlichia ruminantium]|uniref:Uncharacterized protein n=1 Tax=Ehrlichia ruminantium TaxID=779 RepID=A0AAE6Q9M5_EHRRU|nr:hypothetical protein EDL81_01180 [Ehrlichia ruminantium]QGR03894.1 hypothetical protein EDL80_01180 [Ehrlichia ruminantium]QGR04819.1 hypothetical protein EDL79_01180 [Ehrlichia ruminantium]